MNASANLLLSAFAIVLVAASFSHDPTLAAQRYTSAFQNGTAEIASIALLPPESSTLIRKIGEDTIMAMEGTQLDAIAAAITQERFEQAGYEFRSVTQEEIEADPQLGERVRRASRRFESEYAKLVDEPRDLAERRYGIGETAVSLADYLGVDAIAFQKVEAEGAAGGRMKRAFSPRGSKGRARVDLTIVHGATGDFEAYFSGATRGLKAFRLRNYPAAVISKAAKLAYARLPELHSSRRTAVADDQGVLDEFESLLSDDESTSLD